jgi:hypothetical protein
MFSILSKNRLIGDFSAGLERKTLGRKSELVLADDFRTLRWEEVYKYPEVALGQIRELLESTLKT